MRKILSISTLSLLFAVGAVGCADETTPAGNPDTTVDTTPDTEQDTQNDVSPDVENDEGTPDADAGPDMEEEVEPQDPCDPNPCTTKAADCGGDDMTATTYTTPGTCTDNGGTAECTYEVDTETACEAGTETCIQGACVPVGDPTQYVFSDQASYVTSIAIPTSDDPPCCFDFGGADDAIDNKLGDLLGTISGLVGDIDANALIAEAIADGSLAILLEYVGLDDATDDSDLTMNGFYGEPTTEHSVNITGEGEFTVDASSFAPGTAQPLIAFPASITGGLLEAGPSLFTLVIPFGDIIISATVSGTRVEATATMHTNGKGLELTDGKLGGYVAMADLAAALNAYISTSCACLNLPGDLINVLSEDKISCNKGEPDADCDDTCTQIHSFCGAATAFLKPDIDSDDNGLKDSISIGVTVEATAATITGVTPEAPPAP